MSGFLYEKDLVPQKYRILTSVRHDRLVRGIASDLGMPVQELRRHLIDRLDMILLENLPARAEAAEVKTGGQHPLALALGREKYTEYIPIVPVAAMDAIFREVDEHVRTGMPAADALALGKVRIRGVLRQ